MKNKRENPPKCFRDKFITPNLDPYSICLDCTFRTPCTTAILDDPKFEYASKIKEFVAVTVPESSRNQLVKDLVEFCDNRITGYCVTLETYDETDIRYKRLALKIDELKIMKSMIEEHGAKKE